MIKKAGTILIRGPQSVILKPTCPIAPKSKPSFPREFGPLLRWRTAAAVAHLVREATHNTSQIVGGQNVCNTRTCEWNLNSLLITDDQILKHCDLIRRCWYEVLEDAKLITINHYKITIQSLSNHQIHYFYGHVPINFAWPTHIFFGWTNSLPPGLDGAGSLHFFRTLDENFQW